MTSFLFSSASTENLSTGTFYLHLVNSVPSASYTTANQLNISDAINYTPVILTGLIYDTKRWTFSDCTFPAFTFNTVPVGVVICKRLSSNPSPSDSIFYYADIANVLNQNFILTTGKYSISIAFPKRGVLVFSNYYQYYAGNYSPKETIPKGLMYLLGTRNDTQSHTSPLNNAFIDNYYSSSCDLFNRNMDNIVISQDKYSFNFGSRRIQVGTVAFWTRDTRDQYWSIYGSNTYVFGSLDIASDWTLLASSNNTVAGINFMISTNTTYWKNVKLVSSDRFGVLQEIEFYNSSMYSTDMDLMSTVIDSPFDAAIVDNTGFNHVWSNVGAPTINNNSLKLGYSDRLLLSNSRLFDLTNRNFKLSITGSVDEILDSSSRGWVTFDGLGPPVAVGYIGEKLYTGIGTGDNYVYYPNSAAYPINSSYVGTLTVNNFDKIATTRNFNIFTTFVNDAVVYSTTINFSVGSAVSITLGLDGNAMTGRLKDFKLVT